MFFLMGFSIYVRYWFSVVEVFGYISFLVDASTFFVLAAISYVILCAETEIEHFTIGMSKKSWVALATDGNQFERASVLNVNLKEMDFDVRSYIPIMPYTRKTIATTFILHFFLLFCFFRFKLKSFKALF